MDKFLNKTKLNKLLAVCMTIFMAMTLVVTGINANIVAGETGTITVTGLSEGTTVSAYQIIGVNFNIGTQQPSNPMYTWTNAAASILKTDDANDKGYNSYINSSNNAVTNAYSGLQGGGNQTKMRQFSDWFTEEFMGTETPPTTTYSKTASNGTVAIDVPMGSYLVVATNPGDVQKVYKPTIQNVLPQYDDEWSIVSPASFSIKSGSVGITKTVNKNTFAVGDTLTYTLEITVPEYPANGTHKTLTVEDTLPTGVTYAAGTATVKVGDTALVKDDDFTETGTTEITWEFAQWIAKQTNDITQGTTITIEYDVMVTSDVLNTTTNKAVLTYDNNPYVDSNVRETASVNSYTYDVTITKQDKNSVNLAGAEFELVFNSSATPLKFTKNADDSYTIDSNGDSTITSTDGTIRLHGLNLGEYTLTETKAPNGYALPTGHITFTLAEDTTVDGNLDAGTSEAPLTTVTTTGTSEIDQTNTKINDTNQAQFDLVVLNTSQGDVNFGLPNTGGMGTLIFTVGGIALMAGAVFFLIASKRKEQEN